MSVAELFYARQLAGMWKKQVFFLDKNSPTFRIKEVRFNLRALWRLSFNVLNSEKTLSIYS